MIGPNNSGKTFILRAIDCFFNPEKFLPENLNITEYRSRLRGYNKSSISITLDVDEVKSRKIKETLQEWYGSDLEIERQFTYKEGTERVEFETVILGNTFDSENPLPHEVAWFLSKINVSYIHPQEGKELLLTAQRKLKERLLSFWGSSGPQMKESLEQLQVAWKDLRGRANSFLSRSLTENLQEIWPGSEVEIGLPKSIDDIIAVSEINFKADDSLPSVEITAQGTGAQSTILYQTHYILDSDRSLHRGEYHPIWLLEEPEAFLHADIIIKLGKLLNSGSWLNRIQMIISTHSPLLLAASGDNNQNINWCLLHNAQIRKCARVVEWSEEDVEEIGQLMGDSNFDAYFYSAKSDVLLFLEDDKQITLEKLTDGGLNITRGLGGISEVDKYFYVLSNFPDLISSRVYFLVDGDRGLSQAKHLRSITNEDPVETISIFKKYSVAEKIFIIVIEGNGAEALFLEFETFLRSCVSRLFDSDSKPIADVPRELTGAFNFIRKNFPPDIESAMETLRNHEDIKSLFWKKVEVDNLNIAPDYARALLDLIN